MLERFNAYPRKTVMVGDTKTDYNAAIAAGIDFALVRTGKGYVLLSKLNCLATCLSSIIWPLMSTTYYPGKAC
jgi:phosphoglycolate phosphatase-like HAD superfamily hydrolase